MDKYILIVDDSITIRASAEFALVGAGFFVKTAEHGIDAFEKLNETENNGDKIVMIICDINMPEMDGITFIKEIKKTDFRFIPILVMTTETQESKKMEGKAAGAAGWLTKPFEAEQLVHTIKRFVK